MARKNNEEVPTESLEEPIEEPIEEPVKEPVKEPIEEPVKKPIKAEKEETGKKVTVYRNEGEELLLVDSQGNGIRIRTPEKYRNVKKGDIVYL